MRFVKKDKTINRWNSGPYVICKYDYVDKKGKFFAYRYFKYKNGGRDAKRLHPEKEPPQSLAEAKRLCEKVSQEPVPDGILLVDAP